MDSTEKGVGGFLNAEDICKILKAAKEAGVYAIECGPLWARFGAPSLEPASTGSAPTKAEEDLGKTIQAQQQAEEASLLEEEIVTKERRIEDLIVEDPLAYEEMIERGELEPEGANGSGDEAQDI